MNREKLPLARLQTQCKKNHINIYCSHSEINKHEKVNETRV